MTVKILEGDVFDQLANIPAGSVNCVVTSPPYWGLRDYGVAGQIGLEPTLGEHLDVMVRVFAAVRRVLCDDGSVWLNYGDCYASQPNGRSAAATKAAGKDDRTFRDKPFSTVGPIYDPAGGQQGGGYRGRNKDNVVHPAGRVVAGGRLKPKDLCMVPNRLAIALQDDGWWVRSEIIWGKPNGMPDSSGRWRPSTAHEKIFLLAKTATMFYDAAAVRMTAATTDGGRLLRNYEPDLGGLGGAVTPEVWHIATAAFAGAHFATFPPALVEPCIKAGCPAGGMVLDPFGGAGTVGLVADRLGRDCTMIEIKPEYAAIARRRVAADAPLFGGVAR